MALAQEASILKNIEKGTHMHQKILPFVICTTLSACGISGELGQAQFEIGSGWDGTAPIAVGSEFPIQAHQGFWQNPLEIRGCEEQLLISGNIAVAQKSGSCTIEALDEEGTLVDHFSLSFEEVTTISLRDIVEPNSHWSRELPERFAIIEESQSDVLVTLKSQEEFLLHQKAIELEKSNDGHLYTQLWEERLSLEAVTVGTSFFRISDQQGLMSSYQIDVIPPSDVHSVVIQLSPELAYPLEPNESPTTTGSYVYVFVDARTRDQHPILLPKDSVFIVGSDTPLETGSTGFWVSKSPGETLQVQISLGETMAFAYID